MSQKQKFYKAEEVDELLQNADDTMDALLSLLLAFGRNDTELAEHYVLDFSEQKKALLEKVKEVINNTISRYDFEQQTDVDIENVSGNRFEVNVSFNEDDLIDELTSDIEEIFKEDEEEEED